MPAQQQLIPPGQSLGTMKQQMGAAAVSGVAGSMALQNVWGSLNQSEIVDWTIYDDQTISAGATLAANYSFFQTAQGGVSSKTLVNTNMSGQGVLPASQAFVLTGISVTVAPTCSFLDWNNLALNAYFTFQISNKIYLQLPLFEIPGGSVPIRNAVTNQGASYSTDALLAGSISAGNPDRLNVYKFRYPQPIWVQEQFIATVTTPGVAGTLLSATPAAPTAAIDTIGVGLHFWVNLHGILYRNVR